jgi:F0F1-type ATP synthase delta subunit
MAPKLKEQVVQSGALPLAVVSPVDLGRLLRELDAYDNELEQKRLAGDNAPKTIIKTSKLLELTADQNKIDLSVATQRKNLKEFLLQVKTQAPLLHMSFSADPSAVFVDRLMTWLRREIHPNVLLTIGMQPNIGAGCIVRSTNKYFDFSLRKDFERKGDALVKALQESG